MYDIEFNLIPADDHVMYIQLPSPNIVVVP